MNVSTAVLEPVDTWHPVVHLPRRVHDRPRPVMADPGAPRGRWVEALTRSVVEVLSGRRPATSLAGSTSPAVFEALRAAAVEAPLRHGRVLSLRCQPLGGESVEVAAVVSSASRTRAMTLRLQRRRSHWRCVSVAVL